MDMSKQTVTRKLFIIEDDQVLANVLSRRLSQQQFTCAICSEVSEALLRARIEKPQYILLDMKLGHASGLQLIKPLRAILPYSRIILLTGYASIATAVDAIKLGADDYLAKPVDTQTVVRALLGRSVEVTNVLEPVLTPEEVEWQHIQQVLKYNNGNISATARQLGMHRRTLQRKLQKSPTK
jgi:two-component system response regulator RegA